MFLPLINSEFEINDDVVLSGVQRFMFVILLMLPFEIRDLNYDSLKLATIPQRIGVKQTKVIGLLLTFLIMSLEYFKDNINIGHLISLAIIVLTTMLFLNFATKKQGKYYSAFWVESLPICWVMLLLMFS